MNMNLIQLCGISSLFRYSTDDLVGDLVAGITVGLTVIPQALAYAGIAGLDPAVCFSLIFYDNFILATFNNFRLISIFILFIRSLDCMVHLWAALCTYSLDLAKMFRLVRRLFHRF